MMTKENFLDRIKISITKSDAEGLARAASRTSDSLNHVLDLTFHNEAEVAFRAAWVLEHSLIFNQGLPTSMLQRFLELYPKQKNRSCQRHYTKILMFYSTKDRVNSLTQYELTDVVETTFEWLIDPETPVAVKVNCMDILFNLRNQYDWISDELKDQIIFHLRDGSAAMQSRGKRLLKYMK
ncbi:MAG: hypothetical protein H7Y13_17780 [Sphingobacteriaceae bacterium]|nr:hypothetical protein [Sphingobacteriaceae bacterium]